MDPAAHRAVVEPATAAVAAVPPTPQIRPSVERVEHVVPAGRRPPEPTTVTTVIREQPHQPTLVPAPAPPGPAPIDTTPARSDTTAPPTPSIEIRVNRVIVNDRRRPSPLDDLDGRQANSRDRGPRPSLDLAEYLARRST
jgi:hypothetical protein